MTKAKILFLLAFLWGSIPALHAQIKPGAENMDKYLPLLKGKKVALVVNQTSMVGKTHLLDTLLSRKVDVRKIYAPEHGFRGDHSAGAHVADSKDSRTGLPLVSLYGKNKKPQSSDLAGVDILIFDIQDVGVRYYTYISTLHYVMEACAENNKPLLVLDRPNPHGNYIDGPVLEKEFKSFVGMHPVPLVHGMTIGEYAQMINGEGWLANAVKCKLTVIPVEKYNHTMRYDLPVPPSPNLASMEAIYLYPSLGLFEGTDVSVGRGTDHPFEVIGRPGFKGGDYEFTPKSIPGKAENPPHKDVLCNGFNLADFANQYIKNAKEVYLYWLIGFYEESPDKTKFFNDFFDKLAGTDKLRKQIESGMKPEQIRASWKKDLENYSQIRKKYLLYSI